MELLFRQFLVSYKDEVKFKMMIVNKDKYEGFYMDEKNIRYIIMDEEKLVEQEICVLFCFFGLGFELILSLFYCGIV